MAELVDAVDLKSTGWRHPCRFDSDSRHHFSKSSNLISILLDAGWSSLVARRAHNPKVVGSNPTPATILCGRS